MFRSQVGSSPLEVGLPKYMPKNSTLSAIKDLKRDPLSSPPLSYNVSGRLYEMRFSLLARRGVTWGTPNEAAEAVAAAPDTWQRNPSLDRFLKTGTLGVPKD